MTQSHLEVAQAARTQLYRDHTNITSPTRVFQHHGYVAQLLECEITQHAPVTIEKVVRISITNALFWPRAGAGCASGVGEPAPGGAPPDACRAPPDAC